MHNKSNQTKKAGIVVVDGFEIIPNGQFYSVKWLNSDQPSVKNATSEIISSRQEAADQHENLDYDSIEPNYEEPSNQMGHIFLGDELIQSREYETHEDYKKACIEKVTIKKSMSPSPLPKLASPTGSTISLPSTPKSFLPAPKLAIEPTPPLTIIRTVASAVIGAKNELTAQKKGVVQVGVKRKPDNFDQAGSQGIQSALGQPAQKQLQQLPPQNQPNPQQNALSHVSILQQPPNVYTQPQQPQVQPHSQEGTQNQLPLQNIQPPYVYLQPQQPHQPQQPQQPPPPPGGQTICLPAIQAQAAVQEGNSMPPMMPYPIFPQAMIPNYPPMMVIKKPFKLEYFVQ